MKLNAYNPSATKNITGGRVDLPGNAAAFGADQSGLSSVTGAVATAFKDMQARILEDNRMALLQAQNKMQERLNHLLYNDENGLMHTELDGAKNIDAVFMEEEAKIREEIAKELPNYNHVHRAFQQSTDSLRNSYGKTIEVHVRQERDKNIDVSVSNAMHNIKESTLLGYQNPEFVKMNGNRIKSVILANYGDRGEDFVNGKTQEQLDTWGTNVLTHALTENNYESIPGIVSELRSHGVSETILTKANETSKEVLKKVEINNGLQDLIAMYKDDAEAAYQAYMAKADSTGINESLLDEEVRKNNGKPYLLGADGDSATDCGKYTQDTMAKLGITLNYRTADGQYKQFEESGKVFTDSAKLKKGDLVFWHVPGNEKRWATSEDPNAVNSDNLAYKGITHVGIYMGNGMVSQAGSSGGVQNVSLDIYPVVGFGSVGKEALTESQKMANKELFMNMYEVGLAKAKRKENARIADRLHEWNEAKLQMLEAGYGAAEMLEGMNGFVRNDEALRKKMLPQMIAMQAQVNAEKLQSMKAGVEQENALRIAIRQGLNEREISQLIVDSGRLYTPQQLNSIWEYYGKKQRGEGEFSPEMEGVKGIVKKNYKGNDFDRDWLGVEKAIYPKVSEYMSKNNNQKPPPSLMIEWAGEALVMQKLILTGDGATWFGGENNEFKFSNAKLSVKGIESVERVADNQGNPYVRFRMENGAIEDMEPETARKNYGE